MESLSGIKELSISWNPKSDNASREISGAIANLSKLTYLRIDYGASKITDTTVEFMPSYVLGWLTNLTHLDLQLWKNEGITDNGIIALADQLPQLAKLQTLTLNLDHESGKFLFRNFERK
eukprot:TRINITY_DN17698_c1_g1_i1.p1 TRINITY_DN17698_c1_g1~~TRINITY_DN17698_c1_g1_i1.p1  ORF type:complete len:120 (+),score=15.91 TRINITY_DN17698_c1_g1_i1:107-466(+)